MDWRVWYVADRKRMGDPRLALPTTACSTCCGAGAAASSRPTSWLVASNHPDLRADVDAFGLPYHHVPVDRADKAPAEARLLELLGGNVDLVVLARYMQILSGDFLDRLGVPGDQHPPLVPARVRRRGAVREGQGPRRQAHRRHRPLRDRGARRGADHRAGRHPRLPPRHPGDAWRGWAATSSAPCSRAPWAGTARTACSSTTRPRWCSERRVEGSLSRRRRRGSGRCWPRRRRTSTGRRRSRSASCPPTPGRRRRSRRGRSRAGRGRGA